MAPLSATSTVLVPADATTARHSGMGPGGEGRGTQAGGAHHDTNGDGDEWGVLGTRGQRLSLRNRGGWWMSALMNIQRREVTGNGQKHRGVNGVGNKA